MPTGSTQTDAQRRAAQLRLQAANEGPADRAQTAAANALRAAGLPATMSTPAGQGTITQYQVQRINDLATNMGYRAPQTQQAAPRRTTTTSSSGGSRGYGGGGGGGGAAVPKFTQAQLDWAAQLMQGARPGALSANTLDLPDYQGMALRAFDPTMWNQARTALGEGYNQDIGTAQGATQNMLNFLNTNYTNAFNNPNATYATAGQAPGMDQAAMQRMMQAQGVNPALASQQMEGAAGADQAFGNLWRVLAGNEDLMQRNRQANAQQYGTQATDAITAAKRAGDLGLNLGQGQAQSAWQTAADQRAYQDYQMQQQIAQQEAQANWERANQIQDVNSQNTNSYNNSVLSSLLGLLPQLQTNPALTLPTLQSLGLA